jgi:hypothetical protein
MCDEKELFILSILMFTLSLLPNLTFAAPNMYHLV